MYNGTTEILLDENTQLKLVTTPKEPNQQSLVSRITWSQLEAELSKKVKKHALQTWFSGAQLREIADNHAVIAVKNEFTRNFIFQTYIKEIEEALKEVSASNLGVRLVVDPNLELVITETQQTSFAAAPVQKPRTEICKLNSNYLFSNFVSTKANRLSLLFIRAFIEGNSDRYRSLFIHSASGLGKTHLLHAIGKEIQEQNPQAAIKYTNAESFANEFFQALRNKQMHEFQNKYRKLDLLLFDDAHFLENKKSTQEEFFYTFENITNNGGKVVLSASKSSTDFNGLSPHLASRLNASLSTQILEHDLESRLEILSSKAKSQEMDLSQEQLQYIAVRSKGNIRELDAALTKLYTFKECSGDIDDESVASLFTSVHSSSAAYLGLDIGQITSTVASYFGISEEDLRSSSRVKELSRARHIAIYIARELLQISHTRIGQQFSNRKHSSIIHSIKLIQSEIVRDRSTALVVEDIKARLRG